MPSRNTVKNFDSNAFYHVYNRGAGGQKVFVDSHDKHKFLSLLRRHTLDTDETEEYRRYQVEVMAYCLLPNHFHLLLWQSDDPSAITGMMRSVSTAYSMYFNRRHKQQGRLFQSIFRAAHVSNESYLSHVTRYIHLNPDRYRTYYWSSLKEYLGERHDELVKHERLLDMSPNKYMDFLQEFTDRRHLIKGIEDQISG